MHHVDLNHSRLDGGSPDHCPQLLREARETEELLLVHGLFWRTRSMEEITKVMTQNVVEKVGGRSTWGEEERREGRFVYLRKAFRGPWGTGPLHLELPSWCCSAACELSSRDGGQAATTDKPRRWHADREYGKDTGAFPPPNCCDNMDVL